MEEFLLSGGLAADELDVVHQKQVCVAVFFAELHVFVLAQGGDELVGEGLGVDVNDVVVGEALLQAGGDGVEQMRFAKAGRTVDKQGIVGPGGVVGDSQGSVVGKAVRGADHELVKGELRVEPGRFGRGLFLRKGGHFLFADDVHLDLLVKQVAHAACADAHVQLHEVGAGDRVERDLRLAGNGLGQERLACARRPNEKRAFRHGRADLLVFVRMVQEINQLDQGFLGLVLARYIREGNARIGLHIDLGVALAEIAHAAEAAEAAAAAPHEPHDELADGEEEHDRQDPVVKKAFQGRAFPRDNLGEGDFVLFQARQKLRVLGAARDVDLFVVGIARRGRQALVTDFHLGEFAFVHHLQERAVRDVVDLGFPQGREHVLVQQHDDEKGQDIIKVQRPASIAVVAVFLVVHVALLIAGYFSLFYRLGRKAASRKCEKMTNYALLEGSPFPPGGKGLPGRPGKRGAARAFCIHYMNFVYLPRGG